MREDVYIASSHIELSDGISEDPLPASRKASSLMILVSHWYEQRSMIGGVQMNR